MGSQLLQKQQIKIGFNVIGLSPVGFGYDYYSTNVCFLALESLCRCVHLVDSFVSLLQTCDDSIIPLHLLSPESSSLVCDFSK